MSTRFMRLLILMLAAGVLAAAVGCGGDDSSSSSGGGGSSSSSSSDQPGKGKPAVTLGTKDFTEEFILGELYKQALQAKGYSVNLKKNIGATEITDKAMTSGAIDGYPEYSGESTATVFGIDKIYDSPEATVADAKKHYEARGQVVSNPTPFEDVDAIAATKAFAEKNGLASMEDLKKLTPSFTLGARPEFKNRQVGLKGMKDVYGIDNAKFKQLALGLQYKALDKGDVDTANIFSTDAQLASGKYTVLKDPKGVFGFQNVLFVINKPKYDALGGTAFMDVINKVNTLLTAEAMRSMNSAVDIDKKDPAEVAKSFLSANKLT